MKYKDNLKIGADTYFFPIVKIALFFTALFALFILYLVQAMNSSPELAVIYYYEIPGRLQNVLLVCAAATAVGAAFEAETN